MPGQSILIVENDTLSAQTFEKMLAAHGHTVRTVSDTESARREMDREMPTVAIVDLHLPLANGLELLRPLRAQIERGRLSAALITGDYFVDDRVTDELQTLGIPLHFKPLWEEDVLQIVESLTARREICPVAAK